MRNASTISVEAGSATTGVSSSTISGAAAPVAPVLSFASTRQKAALMAVETVQACYNRQRRANAKKKTKVE